MARGEGFLEERLDVLLPLDDPSCGQQFRRNEALEGFPPQTVWRINQRASVHVEQVEEVQLQRDLLFRRLDAVHAAESAHQVLERERFPLVVRGDDFPLEEELRGGQRPGNRDDLRKARGDVAEPPTENADRVALPVDLDSCAVELVFDRGLAAVFRQDLVEVFGHFREHRLHRSEKTQAPGPKRVRALEQGNLCDPPEVPEEHVGRPHGVRVDARGVGDPFEHHAFVHADPHLAEDVLQEDVPLVL